MEDTTQKYRMTEYFEWMAQITKAKTFGMASVFNTIFGENLYPHLSADHKEDGEYINEGTNLFYVPGTSDLALIEKKIFRMTTTN
jgi:hypothetical protein